MDTRPLAALLTEWPRPLPVYLARVAVEVDFAPAYSGREDRETIADAFAELDALLKAGFFAWRHIEARRDAAIAIAWRDVGFTIHATAAGLHHNLLVVLLRMIVSLHHTPADSRAELVAALGDDADALPPPTRWADALRAIRLIGIEPVGAGTADHEDPDAFVIDAEIRLPAGFDPDAPRNSDDRLVIRLPDAAALPGKRAWKAVENGFLGVCNTGGFRSLTRLDQPPEEAELFTRQGARGTELVIDDYADDRYGLVELLNAISTGRVAEMAVDDAG